MANRFAEFETEEFATRVATLAARRYRGAYKISVSPADLDEAIANEIRDGSPS